MKLNELVDDIEVCQGDGSYIIVGSKHQNEYIRLKTSRITGVESLLRQYNGMHDRHDIEEFCKENNIQVNLDEFEKQLSLHGLFKSAEKANNVRNEIEVLGFKLFLFTVKDKKNTWIKKLVSIISGSFILLAVLCIIWSILNYKEFIMFFSDGLLKYRNSYALGFAVTIACSYLILFLHEFGHIIAGYTCGLTLHRFGLFVYMGFIPQWFVSFRGIRTASRRARINIYCAGVYVNLFIVLVSCSFSNSGNTDFMHCIAASSLYMGINSLFPFNLTDGYFLFSAILRRDNLRQDMLKVVYNLLAVHKKVGDLDKMLLIYLCVNVLFYFFKLLFCYYWIFQSLLEFTKYALILTMICFLLHSVFLLKHIGKNMAYLKE